MTHHRISIGITSYKDLSDSDVAKEVYAILAETAEGFAPNRMQAGFDRIIISTQREFVENWVLKGSSELRESRNKNAKILERREALWPAEWFHVGKYKGRGNLQLRHRNDLEAPDGISMELK